MSFQLLWVCCFGNRDIIWQEFFKKVEKKWQNQGMYYEYEDIGMSSCKY